MILYLDYIGLAKTLRGIKNQLDTKINNSDVSITNGVITINSDTLTPITDVQWDASNHTLKGTKNGTPFNIVVGGANNGIAFLDANGKVDPSQLPSYVDDIVDGLLTAADGDDSTNWHTSYRVSHEYNVGDIVCDDTTFQTMHLYYYVTTYFSGEFDSSKCLRIEVFPNPGQKGKIYYNVKTDKSYRWSGTTYVEIIAHAGSTDDIPEGSTNLYFTDARALAAVATALAGKANKNGSTSENFAVNALTSEASITSKGDIVIKDANNNTVVTIGTDGKITVSDKIITPEIGNTEGGANSAAPLKVNSAPGSVIPSGSQANVAYIVEPTNNTNPGLLDPLDTSELYDAFAAAGITLGANKNEGMAILDGTTPSVGE